jgi:hypothetical protein
MSPKRQSFPNSNHQRLDTMFVLPDRKAPSKISNSMNAGSGMDTDATSESEMTACFDYAGIYSLAMVCDDFRLETSHHNVVGGYVAFQAISNDVYNIILDTHRSSNRVLQGSICIAPCMDYTSTTSDHDKSPYDDIIGVHGLKWVHKMETDEDEVTFSLKEQLLENAVFDVLSKCDMIRFVGDLLVLEGPRGAIECIVHD